MSDLKDLRNLLNGIMGSTVYDVNIPDDVDEDKDDDLDEFEDDSEEDEVVKPRVKSEKKEKTEKSSVPKVKKVVEPKIEYQTPIEIINDFVADYKEVTHSENFKAINKRLKFKRFQPELVDYYIDNLCNIDIRDYFEHGKKGEDFKIFLDEFKATVLTKPVVKHYDIELSRIKLAYVEYMEMKNSGECSSLREYLEKSSEIHDSDFTLPEYREEFIQKYSKRFDDFCDDIKDNLELIDEIASFAYPKELHPRKLYDEYKYREIANKLYNMDRAELKSMFAKTELYYKGETQIGFDWDIFTSYLFDLKMQLDRDLYRDGLTVLEFNVRGKEHDIIYQDRKVSTDGYFRRNKYPIDDVVVLYRLEPVLNEQENYRLYAKYHNLDMNNDADKLEMAQNITKIHNGNLRYLRAVSDNYQTKEVKHMAFIEIATGKNPVMYLNPKLENDKYIHSIYGEELETLKTNLYKGTLKEIELWTKAK